MINTNPFSITKAVDLTDAAIYKLWVDMPRGSKAFLEMIKPNSAMPQIILGGKGSGKTHLMKYYSYPLRKIHYNENIYQGIRNDNFVGVFFRCEGLNSSRFSGKGVPLEIWKPLFYYYFDLWIAQNFMNFVVDLAEFENIGQNKILQFCNGVKDLFNIRISAEFESLKDVVLFFKQLQMNLDNAVNNCAINRQLDGVEITTNNGSLVFGLPKLAKNLFDLPEEFLFIYMIDELENLSEDQQIYLQTLIREKQPPSTFRIGSRLYGLRTLKTLSGNEENKEGSEYEIVPLDNHLRVIKSYPEFLRALVDRRIVGTSGFIEQKSGINFDKEFDDLQRGKFAVDELQFINKTYSDRERPYFSKLRKKLEKGMQYSTCKGVKKTEDIEEIINLLMCNEFPLIEKTATFLLYKAWYSKRNLLEAANEICDQIKQTKLFPDEQTLINKTLDHFQNDMISQIYRECKRPEKYYGFPNLISLSNGLPRNLLILLKNIHKWAVFNGEKPFEGIPISIASQIEGIEESSHWFYTNSQLVHKFNADVQEGIKNLCELFSDIRYSDKPSECSLCAFSTEIHQCSENAKSVIDLAEKLSLLIRHPGRKNKNKARTSDCYQINPMLAPKWTLPISIRGVIELNPDEVNSIFDRDLWKNFDNTKISRTSRMNAPTFGNRAHIEEQIQLNFLELE